MKVGIYVNKVQRFLKENNLEDKFKEQNPDFDGKIEFQTIEEKISEVERFKDEQTAFRAVQIIEEEERLNQISSNHNL